MAVIGYRLVIFRGGKYTEKEFKTEEQAKAYADKRKTGQIVLCELNQYGKSTYIYYKEVLKGNVKEIHRERGGFNYIKDQWEDGETLDEIFGQHKRIFGQFVTRVDENALHVGRIREVNTNIEKTESGFVKITEYDVNRGWLKIVKNQMQEYTFDDFFGDVEMTDEERDFLKGQYRTAWTVTKFVDWEKWRRYEAACGGDISFDEI